jgi:hypothetical protein
MSTPRDTQSFIIWMMAGIAEGDCAQGDEALDGNGDNFGIFRCAAHEDFLYTNRLS